VRHRCLAAAAALSLASLQAAAQPATTPLPDGGVSVVMRCRDCGVIHSIREVQRTREGAASTVGGGAPVGFVVYIPIGPGRSGEDSYVGSVGSREWQNRTTRTYYEFTVRMDDGDYRVVPKDGMSDLQVGDRVRIIDGRIERWGR